MRIEETDKIDICRALRRTVFIEEQGIAESDEIDDLDGEAIHLLAWQDGQAVGTARILPMGNSAKIGRVCVVQQARGTDLGTKLIRAAIDVLRARPGIAHVKIGSQLHATGFYEKLGFDPVGEVYDDAGVLHRDMIREL